MSIVAVVVVIRVSCLTRWLNSAIGNYKTSTRNQVQHKNYTNGPTKKEKEHEANKANSTHINKQDNNIRGLEL